jgi:hypothetical protein
VSVLRSRNPWVKVFATTLVAIPGAAGLGYLDGKWAGAAAVAASGLGIVVLAALIFWLRMRRKGALWLDDAEWNSVSRWGYLAGKPFGGWNPRSANGERPGPESLEREEQR